MSYKRTTITIPEDVYKRTKIEAARHNTSMSGYISDLLRHRPDHTKTTKTSLPIGTLNLEDKPITRDEIYDDHIKRKISR